MATTEPSTPSVPEQSSQAFKPIHYDARQVEFMATVAALYNPDFAKFTAASDDFVTAVIRYFDLKRDEMGYVWQAESGVQL